MRPERNQRLWRDTLIRRQRDAVPARHRRQNQQRLDDRELIADALARAAAERKVGEARTLGDRFRRESSWIETLGIGPEVRTPMHDERNEKNDRAFRDVVATQAV